MSKKVYCRHCNRCTTFRSYGGTACYVLTVQDEGKEKPAIPFKAFAGFSGFGEKGPSSSKAAPSFSFNASKASSETSVKSAVSSETGAPAGNASASSSIFSGVTDGASSVTNINTEQRPSKFLKSLKGLNESVLRWVESHVQKNPYCILTPVFKDYDKHLADLEEKYPEESQQQQTNGGK